ncbi:Ppx-GppA domain-containing protein [Pycnococcus provasolii]|mmetsp:Transcript_8389/g.21577  ORF Transcript_8389/g.21577 Transcript_8389/m.21577 type:complete len:331 (+) Transcript_8389:2-994(+)
MRRRLVASFDVGSGSTKAEVYQLTYDTSTQRWLVDAEPLLSLVEDVLLAHDLETQSPAECLSESITNALTQAICRLADEARATGPIDVLDGVATAVFRRAKNANEVLERASRESGVSLRVIDQQAEGRLGWATCRALHPDAVLAWDSGGASFQISGECQGELSVFEGPWGASTATAALIREVRGSEFARNSSVNPVSMEECMKLKRLLVERMPDPPVWLAGALPGRVGCFGGDTSAFNVARLVLAADGVDNADVRISRETLTLALERQCAGKSDDELIARGFELQVDMTVPKVVLVLAVLEHVLGDGADVKYRPANGSCAGVAMQLAFSL